MSIKSAATDHPILKILAERWSPYGFDDRLVAEGDLRSLFEAARWAASSYNEQPWNYLVASRENAPEFGRLLSCLVAANQAWLETTGFSSDAVGRSLTELMPAEVATIAAQRFERCIAESEPAAFDEELRFNGYARHWRTTLSPLVIDGSVRYIIGFGHDYTDLRHTTNALAESEAKFRRLVENASDIIYRLRIEL